MLRSAERVIKKIVFKSECDFFELPMCIIMIYLTFLSANESPPPACGLQKRKGGKSKTKIIGLKEHFGNARYMLLKPL